MRTNEYMIISCPRIITMDDALPIASAVCISGGRIHAVGTLEEMRAFAPRGHSTELSLEKGVLVPGFIDSHSHLSMFAQCCNQFFCDISYGSIANMLDAFRAFAEKHAGDEWIIGYCYDDTGMKDNRHLTRHDLDSVCAGRPVFVCHITSHMGYGNTLALEKLGITPDLVIEGGEIVLGSDGQPEGLIKENAYFQAFQKLPTCPDDQIPNLLEQAIAVYNSQGFTMFQEGGVGFAKGAHALMRAYNKLAREGRMNARGYLHFMPEIMDEMLEMGTWCMPVTDYLYYGGLKSFADGSIQSLTAVLSSPYSCRQDFCGNLVRTPEQIARLIDHYHSQGVPVAFHANGDAAIEFVVQGFEKTLRGKPNPVKGDMIIHVQMASDEQLARLKACGVTPTFFVRHVNVWGERHANIFIGEERASRLDPCGSCVRIGLPFALHVDSPVQPVNAIKSMHTAVNRTTTSGRVLGKDQKVSALDALKAYTVNAARCTAREDCAGVIAPGRYADFTLLSDDPLSMPPEEIESIKVLKTISGGRIVYER
ncbi:MAG: amidohydrolase [Mailhella sp.]|nr:amidohydrolase [Mailhella sp.]